ncbi:unnamed protein product [Didymodactylos carnosus]|uniref:Uncharacterized protein n=1 Tax=Didymodactylos carnosus TaxID=1234261 RepID=A0A814QHF5_9BILA|nr:unnamed protein product [Didymodactylos carnosus]CAF3883183.1 unnamed protein product [Didymodactylos carnosus]
MKLSISIVYFVLISPYLLLMDSKHDVYIYSARDKKCDVLFHHVFINPVRVYSIQNSFYILQSNSKVSKLDAELCLTDLFQLKFKCQQLLSAVQGELFTILSDDYSTIAVWHTKLAKLSYISIAQNHIMENNGQIKEIRCLQNFLLVYYQNKYLRLWNLDNKSELLQLGNASMYSVCQNRIGKYYNNSLMLFDMTHRLRGEIKLECKCDHLCLNEDGRYILVTNVEHCLLFMYRVDDGKQIAKLFVQNMTGTIKASKDYVVLTLTNHTLYVLMIADPKINGVREKINTLPSR